MQNANFIKEKKNESIQIGEDIEIKVVQTARGFVKIGIEAPKSVLVLRKELLDEVKDKNLLSVKKDNVALDALSKKIKQ